MKPKKKDIPSERSAKDKGNETKENETCIEPNDKKPKFRAHVADVVKEMRERSMAKIMTKSCYSDA